MIPVEQALENIMSATFGEEVRESIHDAIYIMNENANEAVEKATGSEESAHSWAEAAARSAESANSAAQTAATETVEEAKTQLNGYVFSAQSAESSAMESARAAQQSAREALTSRAIAEDYALQASYQAGLSAHHAEEAKKFTPEGYQELVEELNATETSTRNLENSADGNIRSLRMLGNGRKSKNLFNNSISYSGGSKNYFTSDKVMLPSGTYTASYFNSGSVASKLFVNKTISGSESTIINVTVNANSRGIATFTLTENTLISLGGRLDPTATISDLSIFKEFQINEGSTALPYEPYGLILSEGKIESQSKNMSSVIGGKSFSSVSTGDMIVDAYLGNSQSRGVSEFVNANGEEVTIWAVEDGIRGYIANCDEKGAIINTLGWHNLPYTFTPNTVKFRVMYSYINENLASITSDTKIQIEFGSKTSYVPHKEPTEINASEILSTDFIGVNDIKDELVVYADGSGKFTKKTIKLDLGTLNWNKITTVGHEYYYSVVNGLKKPSSYTEVPNWIISDKYTTDSTDNIYFHRTDKAIGYRQDNSRIWLYDSSLTDTSELNGSILVSALETPQDPIELSPSEVSQLLSLKTFRDNTIITADCEYETGYFVDTEIGQSVADVDVKVGEVASEVIGFADEVEELKELLIKTGTNAFTSQLTLEASSYIAKNGHVINGLLRIEVTRDISAWNTIATIPQEFSTQNKSVLCMGWDANRKVKIFQIWNNIIENADSLQEGVRVYVPFTFLA